MRFGEPSYGLEQSTVLPSLPEKYKVDLRLAGDSFQVTPQRPLRSKRCSPASRQFLFCTVRRHPGSTLLAESLAGLHHRIGGVSNSFAGVQLAMNCTIDLRIYRHSALRISRLESGR